MKKLLVAAFCCSVLLARAVDAQDSATSPPQAPATASPADPKRSMGEIAMLRREIAAEEAAFRKRGNPTDAEVAAVALKREKLLEKQRQLGDAMRKRAQSPDAKAERQAFQEKLAKAAPEERGRLIREHVAVQQAEALERAE